MRLYDSLMSNVKELSENAARLGGATGEILLEECTAKARLLMHIELHTHNLMGIDGHPNQIYRLHTCQIHLHSDLK